MFGTGTISIIMLHILISGTFSCAISKCHITQERGLSFVNCSFRGLIEVPELPKDAFSVNLTGNKIKSLSGSTFSGMKGLSYLDLSDNPLEYISTEIFNGTRNLTSLHIRNSYLYLQKDLILDSLLFGLGKLKHLSFTFLNYDPVDCLLDYEGQPFGKVDALDSIETLVIDSALLKWKGNDSYRTIQTKTKFLYLINGFCFYRYLSENQLNYMPFLKNCTIVYEFLDNLNVQISSHIFRAQKNLKALGIIGSLRRFISEHGFLANLTQSIAQQKTIETIELGRLLYNTRIEISCSVDLSLASVRTLRTIRLVGNSIGSFRNRRHCFPSSLTHLYLQLNCLSQMEIFNLLLHFPQIEVLDASYQNNCAGLSAVRKTLSKPITHGGFSLQKFVLTYSRGHLMFGDKFDLFENLTYLDLSHNENEHNKIPYFLSANRPNLKYLYMTNCKIASLGAHSFYNFTELQYLDLSWNRLGTIGCSLSEEFIYMESLIELNLSNNNIKCITSIFQSMRRIKKIDISSNNIHLFDADLKGLKMLNSLDLSDNKLQTLSDNTIKDLDILSESHTVRLNLAGNLLLCTCKTLGFLRWLASTKVKLIAKDDYNCYFSDGKTTKLEDLSKIIEALTKECTSKISLVVSISAVAAFCLTALSTVIIYRCRWRLRYWYYKFRVKTFYETKGHEYERIFEYDMFISYSSEDHEIARQSAMDELETKRGLRCCIHERDFQPGESIAYNIARGIRTSKRTALFLSKSFLKSEWCLYELNIARMEALHTERKVILIIFWKTLLLNRFL